MVSKDYNSKIESTVVMIKGDVDMSDYESDMIRSCISTIYMPAPSTKLLVSERLQDLLKCKSDLAYITNKLKLIRRDINIPYSDTYNTQFTLLTKKGRPSKQAIDSEIHSIYEDCRVARDKISRIDISLEYCEIILTIIDKEIYTLENRRYDL